MNKLAVGVILVGLLGLLFCKAYPKKWKPGQTHLIMLVHGIHGKDADMQFFVDALSSDSSYAYASCANSGFTTAYEPLQVQGKNLCLETIGLLHRHPGISRISFIGYSMGGRVIRAALPCINRLPVDKHAWISMGSPHEGAPNRRGSANAWIAWMGGASVLYEELTVAPASTEVEMSSSPFKVNALLAHKDDTSIPLQSAHLLSFPRLAYYRHLIHSPDWSLAKWSGRYAHSFGFYTLDVVDVLKKWLENVD